MNFDWLTVPEQWVEGMTRAILPVDDGVRVARNILGAEHAGGNREAAHTVRDHSCVDEQVFILARGQATRLEFVPGAGAVIERLRIHRTTGCGGSSGWALSYACDTTAGVLEAVRRR